MPKSAQTIHLVPPVGLNGFISENHCVADIGGNKYITNEYSGAYTIFGLQGPPRHRDKLSDQSQTYFAQ